MMGIVHIGEAFALTGVGVIVGLLLAWVYGWTDQRWRAGKAEKAQKKCNNCTPKTVTLVGYGGVYEVSSDVLAGMSADPEAERVARLPAYGASKKCAACGHNSFFRNVHQYKDSEEAAVIVSRDKLPPEHQYIVAGCNRCGWTTQERPLFNQGKAGK